ncbi:MAG: RnfABCDGE type electron transport complex subunit D, partial [Planctomycetota bacterium]
MKWLANLLDRARPMFEDGGRLKAFKPLFGAMDAFMLSPLLRTKTSPHVRDSLDVKRYMSMVIVALIPCVLASFYFFGLRVMAMIVVSYAAGGAVEVAFAMIRKEEINEGFLVTGLLFPLILPPALPLWMVGVGVAFGVLVGKELFGGTGRNLFNPALVGRCFLALSYPKAMSSDWLAPGSGTFGRACEYAVDAISEATPLAEAKNVPADQWESLSNLFFGNVTGSVGETSALALIVGGVLLVAIGVASWRTVVSMLVGFVVLTVAIHGSCQAVVWHVLAGGLLFGAFFMATDPVTSPMTNG